MSDNEFVDGLRAFKPHENAPDFIKANLVISKHDLMTWLEGRPDNIRIDLKESKAGDKYYLAVNNWVPENQAQATYREKEPAKYSEYDEPSNAGAPPPPEDFDDPIPF